MNNEQRTTDIESGIAYIAGALKQGSGEIIDIDPDSADYKMVVAMIDHYLSNNVSKKPFMDDSTDKEILTALIDGEGSCGSILRDCDHCPLQLCKDGCYNHENIVKRSKEMLAKLEN